MAVQALSWFSRAVLMAALLFTTTANASTAESRALRLQAVVSLEPSKVGAAETAWRMVRDSLEAEGYPAYTVVSENGAERLIVSVIEDYAALESAHAYLTKFRNHEDKEIAQAVEDIEGALTSVTVFISDYDNQRSYAPPGSYAGPFHQLRTIYFDPADRDKIAALLQRQHDLWKSASVPHAYHVSWRGIGGEISQVTVMTSASSREMHEQIFQEIANNVDGTAALEDALNDLTIRQVVKTWNARIDLRIVPEAMKKE